MNKLVIDLNGGKSMSLCYCDSDYGGHLSSGRAENGTPCHGILGAIFANQIWSIRRRGTREALLNWIYSKRGPSSIPFAVVIGLHNR